MNQRIMLITEAARAHLAAALTRYYRGMERDDDDRAPEGPGLYWPTERGPSLAAKDDRLFFRSSLAPRAAVVPVFGLIWKGAPAWLRQFGVTDPLLAAEGVEQAAADEDVDQIVLLVDSGGGFADGVPEAAERIYGARGPKPIIAQVDGHAASAAYYLASQAADVRVPRLDEVGSIGVRALFFDTSEFFAEMGIKPILVDTGEHKSTGAPGVEVTEGQIAEVRRVVETVFEDFKAGVRLGRGLGVHALDEVADGRMFFGYEAVERGLADRVMTVRDTFAGLAAAGAQVGRTARKRAALTLASRSNGFRPFGRRDAGDPGA